MDEHGLAATQRKTGGETVGLVREIIVVALGGDLLSRQEMVLQK